MPNSHLASDRIRDRMRTQFTFQISVDVDSIPLGLSVAAAAVEAGVDIVELGTPLLKYEGVRNVVPIFRQRFPDAVLLADMKTMDGGGFEAQTIYAGGGSIIDFLALSGVASAKAVVAARDDWRARDAETPRLAFADILVPQQGPASVAADVAEAMVEAGMDGVGVHLQLDARRADPELWASGYLGDVAMAVHERVGHAASVQVVGGLSTEQAVTLARAGLRAFVISGNFGHADSSSRYASPAAELGQYMSDFMRTVSAA